jgi:hypothetical protein
MFPDSARFLYSLPEPETGQNPDLARRCAQSRQMSSSRLEPQPERLAVKFSGKTSETRLQ